MKKVYIFNFMIRFVFILCVSFLASLFPASFSELSAKNDVDGYIRQLKKVLPATNQDCFINVCDDDAKNGVEELHLHHSRYFFVNQGYIVESSRVALEEQMGVTSATVVFANLAASLSDWMECRLQRFSRCITDDVGKITTHRKNFDSCKDDRLLASMCFYKREPFLLACLQEAMAKKAQSTRDDKRSKSVLRGGRSVQEEKAGRKSVVPIEVATAAPKVVKTSDISLMQEEQGKSAIPPQREQKESAKETAAGLFDVKQSGDVNDFRESAIGNLEIMNATGVAPVDYGAIVKELTPKQRIAFDKEYAGTGMTYAQKFEQAQLDGFFEKLARSSTPGRHSVSRSPAKERCISYSPMKQRASESIVNEVRSFSPARERPFAISYANKTVEKKYKKFFKKSENSAANTHFQTFLSIVSAKGLVDYVNRAEPFHSTQVVYKIAVGERARVLFKRGEGDTLILVGDPDHYGDS